jgi:hypothetical protein
MEGKWGRGESGGARRDGVGRCLEHRGTHDSIVPGDQR